MEEKVKFIEHRGQRILVQDLTNSASVEENIGIFDRTREIILAQPPKSVLLFTNVTNAHYSTEAVDHMKKFSLTVGPYIKASAATGVSGIKRIVFQSLLKLTGREIKLFETAGEAMDWLARQ